MVLCIQGYFSQKTSLCLLTLDIAVLNSFFSSLFIHLPVFACKKSERWSTKKATRLYRWKLYNLKMKEKEEVLEVWSTKKEEEETWFWCNQDIIKPELNLTKLWKGSDDENKRHHCSSFFYSLYLTQRFDVNELQNSLKQLNHIL
jgi:hypothetical protein